jgi:5'-nucleotidase
VLTTWPSAITQRESLESMLVSVSSTFTVSNTNNTNRYGEVGLAAGAGVLRQPTDVARPGSSEAAAVAADNLPAASSSTTAVRSTTPRGRTRVRRAAQRRPDSGLRLARQAGRRRRHGIVERRVRARLPQQRVEAEPGVLPRRRWQDAGQASFTNPRTAAPASVGGDLSVGSFNVLNYFTTLGSSDASCQPYTDRAGVGTNVRGGCDLRGAWGAADLARQQSKIVSAINTLDASVVGLMEIENSAKSTPSTPDKAVSTLVAALNAAAGSEKWAYVPASAQLPDASQQDVIRNAIIYQPARVAPSAMRSRSGRSPAQGRPSTTRASRSRRSSRPRAAASRSSSS